MIVVPVVAAALSNVDVNAPGFSSLDRVELARGNPILLAAQLCACEAGAWLFMGPDAPLERPPWPNAYMTSALLEDDMILYVTGGATLAGTSWRAVAGLGVGRTKAEPIVVDETPHALVLVRVPSPVAPTLTSHVSVAPFAPGAISGELARGVYAMRGDGTGEYYFEKVAAPASDWQLRLDGDAGRTDTVFTVGEWRGEP
jgi:hypothetical protein